MGNRHSIFVLYQRIWKHWLKYLLNTNWKPWAWKIVWERMYCSHVPETETKKFSDGSWAATTTIKPEVCRISRVAQLSTLFACTRNMRSLMKLTRGLTLLTTMVHCRSTTLCNRMTCLWSKSNSEAVQSTSACAIINTSLLSTSLVRTTLSKVWSLFAANLVLSTSSWREIMKATRPSTLLVRAATLRS